MAARAYAHWVARGCPDGSPELDWLSAAEDLRSAEAGISDNYSINMTTTKKNPTTKTKTRTPKKIVPTGEPSVVAEAQVRAVEIPVIPVPAEAVVIREPVPAAAVPRLAAPTPAVPMAAVSDAQRDSAANAIVRREMLLAVGAGLVPIPWLDMAAIAGVQLKMVGELAANYGVPFSESRGKAMIGALLGSVIPGQLTAGFLGAVLKMIPFVGMATVPALASATTFALGKVFLRSTSPRGERC